MPGEQGRWRRTQEMRLWFVTISALALVGCAEQFSTEQQSSTLDNTESGDQVEPSDPDGALVASPITCWKGDRPCEATCPPRFIDWIGVEYTLDLNHTVAANA